MPPGLAALIHPHAVSELHGHLRRDEPFAVHGVQRSTADLFAIPFLASLEALLGSWPDTIEAVLPDVADEASTITASPADAAKLFASGMGLLFNDAERF